MVFNCLFLLIGKPSGKKESFAFSRVLFFDYQLVKGTCGKLLVSNHCHKTDNFHPLYIYIPYRIHYI